MPDIPGGDRLVWEVAVLSIYIPHIVRSNCLIYYTHIVTHIEEIASEFC